MVHTDIDLLQMQEIVQKIHSDYHVDLEHPIMHSYNSEWQIDNFYSRDGYRGSADPRGWTELALVFQMLILRALMLESMVLVFVLSLQEQLSRSRTIGDETYATVHQPRHSSPSWSSVANWMHNCITAIQTIRTSAAPTPRTTWRKKWRSRRFLRTTTLETFRLTKNMIRTYAVITRTLQTRRRMGRLGISVVVYIGGAWEIVISHTFLCTTPTKSKTSGPETPKKRREVKTHWSEYFQ